MFFILRCYNFKMEKSQINFNETINAEKQKDDYSSKQKN